MTFQTRTSMPIKPAWCEPMRLPYAPVVQKGDPKGLLPRFNAGLKNAKARGEYDKIYEKWISVKK